MKRCVNCKHHGTRQCPPSYKCFIDDDKPYFEPKKDKSQSWGYVGKKIWHCTLILVVLFVSAAILEISLGVPRAHTYAIYSCVLLSIAYEYFNKDKQ